MKMEEKLNPSNDNVDVPEGDAERAILALAEFHAKGGIRLEDLKAEIIAAAAIRKGEA